LNGDLAGGRVFDRGERGVMFRFTTRIGRSRAGDFDALHIDYDQPGNPFFVRRIADELREIGRGLYLGQGYAIVGGSPRLFVYFGLSA